MGAQGQLTQGAIMRNPRTKYKRSKNVVAVITIALIIGRDWLRLVQTLAQSLTGSSGTLYGGGNFVSFNIEKAYRSAQGWRNLISHEPLVCSKMCFSKTEPVQ